MRPSVLILSPTPPLPKDYGNRNRVFQTCSFFRELNFEIFFLLYPIDADWSNSFPDYYKDIINFVDFLSICPNTKSLHTRANSLHHDIDEWWDDSLAEMVSWLTNRKKFDVVFVNYTFYSAAFKYCSPESIKILDTHDVFSGRREILESNGVEPEFFYTTESEESIALDRSDIVIAIKKEEQEFFSKLTRSNVITIPYWNENIAQQTFLQRQYIIQNKPLKVGFIGAFNSVNVVNMRKFIKELSSIISNKYENIQIHVAGNVCKGLEYSYDWLVLHGRVEKISDFYEQVDLIIAPLDFSTGMKIKVAEALSFGKPVVATKNAFEGFQVFHETQALPTIKDVCLSLFTISSGSIQFNDLLQAAERSGNAAKTDAYYGFESLRNIINHRLSRIFVVVDRAFWKRACFFDEFTAQFIEYLTYIGRVIILYVGDENFVKENIYRPVDFMVTSRLDYTLNIRNLFERFVPKSTFNLCVDSGLKADYERVTLASKAPGWAFEDFVWSKEVGGGVSLQTVSSNIHDFHNVVLSPLKYDPVNLAAKRSNSECHDFVIVVPEDDILKFERFIDLVTQKLKHIEKKVTIIYRPPQSSVSSVFYNNFACISNITSCILLGNPDSSYSFMISYFKFVGSTYFLLSTDGVYKFSQRFIAENYIAELLDRDAESHIISHEVNEHMLAAESGWDLIWQMVSKSN